MMHVEKTNLIAGKPIEKSKREPTIVERSRHSGYVFSCMFCILYAIWYGCGEKVLLQDQPSGGIETDRA